LKFLAIAEMAAAILWVTFSAPCMYKAKNYILTKVTCQQILTDDGWSCAESHMYVLFGGLHYGRQHLLGQIPKKPSEKGVDRQFKAFLRKI